MKKTFFVILLSFTIFFSYSQKVETQKALEIASKYLWERANTYSAKVDYKDLQVAETFVEKNGQTTLYYIFNFTNFGYVIVSADYKMYPILGYSLDGTMYSKSTINDNFAYWLNTYKQEIQYRIQNNTKAEKHFQNAWTRIENINTTYQKTKSTKGVTPLIRSMWDQDSPYNDFCPADASGPGGHVYVGCVATAMSQIMYYYRYPSVGNGNHSYTPNGYPTQSVNYGNTTYHWEEMLNSPGETNDAIATLSWHAGVAVDMMYSADGSGAYSSDVPDALQTYFWYDTDYIAYKSSYTTATWRTKLMTNLDALKPIYYSGSDPDAGGHAFVCDGYHGGDTDTLFHFNWGWSGSGNGYFYLSEMNSGNGNFTQYQAAILNIYPSINYPNGCSSKTLNSFFGTIEDGSGYILDSENNLDCSWLISPYSESGIQGIKLSFEEFDTEAGNDILTIYDGKSISAPIIGQYSGSSLPSELISTNDTIYITYHTNSSVKSKGWIAEYEVVPMTHCTGIITYTDINGTFTDGSNDLNYSNDALCKWKIIPTNATTVTLHFNSLNTEGTNDFIKVYDKYSGGTLMGVFSGNTPPSDLTSTKGSMYLIFSTNSSVTNQGWELSYTSNGVVAVDNNKLENSIQIYPNPLSGRILNIDFNTNISQATEIRIVDIIGKTVFSDNISILGSAYKETINLSDLKSGIYFVEITGEKEHFVKKIIIQ